MELCVLASSSAGNVIAIRNGQGTMLVDAGLSARRIEEKLAGIGWQVRDVRSVLLSHEHSDHTRGVGAFARRFGIPVYGTEGTLQAIKSQWRGNESLLPLTAGSRTRIHGMEVEAFSVPHDVADPVQFIVHDGEVSAGIATDLGVVTALVRQKMRTVDLAVIEANHDADRLRWGAYPWEIKQRVGGSHGHLDNDQAADLALDLAREGVPHIVLAHLSPRHNDVAQVEKVLRRAFEDLRNPPMFTIVPPGEGSPVITVKKALRQ